LFDGRKVFRVVTEISVDLPKRQFITAFKFSVVFATFLYCIIGKMDHSIRQVVH
jgi:uncharacterized membrane protein YagU involved in acid resistance